MKKSVLISLSAIIILAAVAAYGWFVWLPREITKERITKKANPPVLFGKNDYQIVQKNGETFIQIKKAGLRAKVPTGWHVEIKGDEVSKEYWVNLLSPDAEMFDVLTKGCGISIMAGENEEGVEEVEKEMTFIRNKINPEEKNNNSINKKYEFELISINNREGIKWLSQERPNFGQAAGINFIIDKKNNKLINISTVFPPGFKEKCTPIWDDFIKNINISKIN